MTIYSSIKNYIAPPHFLDKEQYRIAGILNDITLAVSMSLGSFLIYRIITENFQDIILILFFCCIVFVSKYLIHRRQLKWSGILLVWCLLGFLEYLSLKSDGLHDTALFAIPGVIIIAGLVLGRRDYFIFILAVLFSIGIIGYLETIGVIENAYSYKTNTIKVINYQIILILSAAVVLFITKNFRKGYIQEDINEDEIHRRTEEALRKSYEQLRNIVDNSASLFYSSNTDLVFTYLSSQANGIFECEPGETVERFADFVTDNPINKQGYEIAQKAIQTAEKQMAYELELLSRKGSRVWLEIQEAPVVKDGKAVSLVGIATDITKRKWAERALQVSEKKYRDIVTWAPIGIYQSTRSGKLLSANTSIATMLGYEAENEFVGCDMGKEIYYDEKDRERFITFHDTSGENVALSYETRWKRKDGSIVWVLMTVHDVRDKKGQILYYEGFVFDITERKYAEKALQESEERYRLLVENSTDLVTEIDTAGKILYVSPNVKTILDFEPADLVGVNVLSKVYGKDKTLIEDILSDQGGNATYRYRDRLGDWHWFESSGRFYTTSSGERRMVMVSRDITQRRKAEQELETSRKQLQHFTEHLEQVLEEERKRISRELHDELGQLLTILKFDLSWLRLEGAKGNLDIVEKIDEMMNSLNEALASVKRISKEIRPPQLDALGLNGALQWDIDQVEKKTNIKGIVTVEPPEFELKGQISAVLYRVFREALTNVVRHAQAQHVYVRLSQRAESVLLSICDDGRGITRRELTGETSLGLVGIRERVRMVGGTLTVEGKPGKGTMLQVEVPLGEKMNGETKL